MTTVDPATGRTLPADAIQRVLFICNVVHVYQIPPLTSTKGYMAASWTADPKRQIFTARVRIIETALADAPESVTTAIVLEDKSSGDLFAAAPYTSAAIVEQVLDSSRFFAVRVQGEGGRKATLGIGFEDRSQAFDFSVTLQEARKVLEGGSTAGNASSNTAKQEPPAEKRDFSLKEGEMITVNIGGKGSRRKSADVSESPSSASNALFSIPPPPSAHNRAPAPAPASSSGFDDDFGEFQ